MVEMNRLWVSGHGENRKEKEQDEDESHVCSDRRQAGGSDPDSSLPIPDDLHSWRQAFGGDHSRLLNIWLNSGEEGVKKNRREEPSIHYYIIMCVPCVYSNLGSLLLHSCVYHAPAVVLLLIPR